MKSSWKGKRLKRICIIRQWYYPIDPRVRKEAQVSVDVGYNVDLICLRKPGEKKRESMSGINIYRLPMKHRRGSIVRYLFEYLFFFLLSGLVLLRLYFRHKYKIIQVNTMPDFLVFATFIPKLLGAKVLLDMHEPVPELWATKFGNRFQFFIELLKLVEQLSIRYADKVLTVTEHLKDVYVSRGADASKITVVLNVPDNKIFNFYLCKANCKGTKHRFILISHGTIEKRWGLDLAIKAVALLRNKIPNIQLNILGEGEYLSELRKLVSELNLGECVHFLGYLPFDGMLKMLAESDIGLVPMEKNAYSDLIHTNKMFEYIAMGKPVIISRTKAVEAYLNDSCLMFFRPGDERDLAHAILELCDNPAKRESLIYNAQKRYEKISWDVMKKIYLEVIGSLSSLS